MEMLVRDLLSYTQVAQVTESVSPVEASEALTDALKNLSGLIEATGAQVTFDPLPAVAIPLVQLRQLFQNLVGNAIKYRKPDSTAVVHISGGREGAVCRFSIADNGIGIEPEYREQIFGLFKRLHNNEHYPGTGIGLALCQRIVERSQGRIWVESEPGRGSTFYFELPG
jgi:light-regulated signal transduction histidine kinase (bacteriophytochrome)